MRKIVISLIIILLTAVIALVGWYLLFGNSDTPAGEAIRGILPFGEAGNDSRPTTDPSTSFDKAQDKSLGAGDQSTTTDEFGQPTANFFRVSDTPVAGAVVFIKNNKATVRYVDRATGHIYDADLATLEKTKVTNNTLPKIYEAYFRPDGNAVLLRSLEDDSDTIKNLSLTLTPPKAALASTSSPQATEGLYTVSSTLIRGDISTVAVGSGNTLFYALQDTRSIVSSAFNGTGIKTIFTSPFTDWRLAAAGNNLIAYTKASANVPGYAYTVNASNGALTKILGPLNGLVVIPNTSNNRILYSYTDGGSIKLLARDNQGKVLSEISPVTLAEKCVWSTRAVENLYCGVPVDGVGFNEPDNWYRGATHFSDRVWLFDTVIQTAQVLVEPKQSFAVDIDVFEPKLSPNEDYLVFTNKTDLSLWALKLD